MDVRVIAATQSGRSTRKCATGRFRARPFLPPQRRRAARCRRCESGRKTSRCLARHFAACFARRFGRAISMAIEARSAGCASPRNRGPATCAELKQRDRAGRDARRSATSLRVRGSLHDVPCRRRCAEPRLHVACDGSPISSARRFSTGARRRRAGQQEGSGAQARASAGARSIVVWRSSVCRSCGGLTAESVVCVRSDQR